jgi:hypothetical protein
VYSEHAHGFRSLSLHCLLWTSVMLSANNSVVVKSTVGCDRSFAMCGRMVVVDKSLAMRHSVSRGIYRSPTMSSCLLSLR